MNEYEYFKKWVNSFGVKIYYKAKPPTKKELYEIAIRQEEEIERLNNIINELSEKNKKLLEDNMRLRKELNLHSGKLYISDIEVKNVF